MVPISGASGPDLIFSRYFERAIPIIEWCSHLSWWRLKNSKQGTPASLREQGPVKTQAVVFPMSVNLLCTSECISIVQKPRIATPVLHWTSRVYEDTLTCQQEDVEGVDNGAVAKRTVFTGTKYPSGATTQSITRWERINICLAGWSGQRKEENGCWSRKVVGSLVRAWLGSRNTGS